jgi:hypothetical protein
MIWGQTKGRDTRVHNPNSHLRPPSLGGQTGVSEWEREWQTVRRRLHWVSGGAASACTLYAHALVTCGDLIPVLMLIMVWWSSSSSWVLDGNPRWRKSSSGRRGHRSAWRGPRSCGIQARRPSCRAQIHVKLNKKWKLSPFFLSLELGFASSCRFDSVFFSISFSSKWLEAYHPLLLETEPAHYTESILPFIQTLILL